MQNLQQDLIELLRQQRPDFFANDQLITDRVAEAAYRYDAGLLALLLNHAGLRGQFFQPVGEAQVFKLQEFETFLHNRTLLPQSYTAYRDRIGLRVARGRYLRESNDVVLAWPYKDCVLEGGQDKDDQKRDEVFYNETLAPDEITRLLAPKALTGFTRYDADGAHPLTADATIDLSQENLLIKGNNLLALHSLLPRFRGQVKLIYIDPPYNTGTDSFKYNDKFNHSSWLTFLKNRLLAAKQLLRKDGVIFIQLDDNEVAYAKVLCDEVFERDNYANHIIIETNSAFGFKGASDSLFKQAGHILFYCRNKKYFKLKKMLVEKEYDKAYKFIFADITLPESEWTWMGLGEALALEKGYSSVREAKKAIGEESFNSELHDYAIDNAERVFRTASVTGGALKKRRETIELSKSDNSRIVRHPNDDMDYRFIGGERVLFYKERIVEIDGEKVPGTLLTDIWLDISIEGISSEGGVKFERGKKPEQLIRRIIELGSQESDLVLDFFAGSGTTAAVAHKMGRRYIAIEQMDYVNTVTVPRLQKVIAGEQGGISKAQNWTGGGISCTVSCGKTTRATSPGWKPHPTRLRCWRSTPTWPATSSCALR
ncbi:site-specific DNA-methyltransferase [Hymenobacter latericus]|uniref:site-specific DNA-methyltransferase n=1 Tax=Hymenobacter sp. YIM 151858-1 TaxID=2987688 RepID=UPI00222807AB|nr:site-specific DNA-methyltransferase [Hymenobacter sp. YIM 151858-1]UYZ58172.1 site-specific DNA-methyltransferase [Hymenobacter sp. YIM 151858-1]